MLIIICDNYLSVSNNVYTFVTVNCHQNTKAQMKIKAKVLEKISESNQVRGRLQVELNKSSFTIHKWIKENDDNLTKAEVLRIIREELGLTDNQILEETSKTAA